MVGLLPIRLLIGLRISVKQKLGIGATFSLGVVIISFSIVRLVKIVDALATLNPDGNISIALWSMLETSIGMAHPPQRKSSPMARILTNLANQTLQRLSSAVFQP
jgi:hypothetical protein